MVKRGYRPYQRLSLIEANIHTLSRTNMPDLARHYSPTFAHTFLGQIVYGVYLNPSVIPIGQALIRSVSRRRS